MADRDRAIDPGIRPDSQQGGTQIMNTTDVRFRLKEMLDDMEDLAEHEMLST